MRLENKVALISGGARGMGASEAKLFATEGASVVIGDVLEEERTTLESEITENGGRCISLHIDVTNEGDWENAMKQALSHFGKIDILVNNAGGSISKTNIEETSLDEFKATFDLNVFGSFQLMKLVIPNMKNQGWPCPVHLALIAPILKLVYN